MAAHPWWRRAQRIAFYLPAFGEISPLALLRRAHRRGRRCYAPALMRGALRFVRHRPGERSAGRRAGAPQPARRRSVRSAQLDLVLVPLLAYDLDGNRLGQGRGCYDRCFGRPRPGRRPRLVGFGYADQFSAELAELAAPWDAPLDAVATERGVARCAGRLRAGAAQRAEHRRGGLVVAGIDHRTEALG